MPGFAEIAPSRPIAGFSPGSRLHGLTLPLLAQVNDGDLVGRWYMASYITIAGRSGAGNVAVAVLPAPFVTYNNISGTPFQPGDAGGDDGTKGPIVTFRSNALLGGIAGYQTSQTDIFDPQKLPVYTAYIKTGPVIAGIRLWVGMYSAGAINQNNDDPGFPGGADTNYAGFRYSDGVDGGFVGVCRNAVGAVFSATPTIKAIAPATEYQLRVRILSATLVGFQVDSEPEVFISGATCPDWTNATNRWLNPTISHINKNAAAHDTGFMGDLVYLAG